MSKSKNLVNFEKAYSAYNAALLRFYISYKDKEKATTNMHDMAKEVARANERSCNAYGVLSPAEKKKVK
jgi:methionyl-tRNA synthetase